MAENEHTLITRRAAKAQGLKRFFTGIPCIHGHVDERLVSNGGCWTCAGETKQRRVTTVAELQYMPKRPCKMGHNSPRMTSNGACIECHRLRAERERETKPEAYQAISARFRAANREKLRASYLEWRAANPEKAAAATKRWNENNAEHVLEWTKAYLNKKWAENPEYRLKVTLRTTVVRVLKGHQKAGSAVRDLGCSIPEAIRFVEAQFTDGMTWENWGTVWELDHKRALGLFNLADRAEFLEAAHFTNLQPLSVEAHKRKTVADRILIKAMGGDRSRAGQTLAKTPR